MGKAQPHLFGICNSESMIHWICNPTHVVTGRDLSLSVHQKNNGIFNRNFNKHINHVETQCIASLPYSAQIKTQI
jgi:hypothetical protein